jgi:prophage regulatory protein
MKNTETQPNAQRIKQPIVFIPPLLLAKPNAAAFLSLSESMFDALVARGEIPKPRKLSAGRTAWLTAELTEFGQNLPVSDLLPPANSGYGRAGKPV